MKQILEKLFRIRFSILLVLVSIVPMIIIGFMAKNIVFNNIKSERIKTLGRVADAKHDQLAMLVKRANNRASILLSNLNSRCNAYQFNEACSINILNIYLPSEGASGATLYNKRVGKSVIVGESAVGYNQTVTFKDGQYAKVFRKNKESQPSYFILVTDEFSGYQLSVTYPVSNMQPIFDRPPDTGALGETFFADGDGLFVTQARYESDQGVHGSPISARPMRSCLSGESKEVMDLDYRNRAVIHGYRFIPEFGSGCIMAHADQEEAFLELTAFERKFNLIALVSIAGVIFTAVYLSRRLIGISKFQQQSENKFRTLFESARDCLVLFDKSGFILDINSTGCSQLGYTKEEMLGKHITNFTSPEIAERSPDNMAKLFREGHILFESVLQRKNGDEMPVEINALLVVLNDQEVVLSAHRDITERKRLDCIVSTCAEKYMSVIETSADGFLIINLQGYIIEVNDAFVKRTGISRPEICKLRLWDLTAHDNIEKTYAHIQKIFRDGNARYDSILKTKNGENWNAEITASYSDIDDGVIFLFIHDITERKKAINKLEESENKFRVLYDNANDGMHILDMNMNIIDINRVGHTRLGYTKEEMVGKSLRNFVPQNIMQNGPELIKKLLEQGHLTFESAHICKDGKILPMEINAQVIEQNGQKMFFSINRDITSRKELQDILVAREAKYRAIIETSADGFWITDMQGRFIEVNDAYLKRSGYNQEEMLSMSISDVEAAEKPEDTAKHIEKVFKDGHDTFESYHRAKDGTIWPVEIHVNFYNIDNQGLLFVFVHDITVREKYTRQLKENEKKFRTLFENANDEMIILDLDGIIVDINSHGYQKLGYSREEMIGKPITKFITEQTARNSVDLMKKLLTQGSLSLESANVRKDGKIIPMEINAQVIEQGGENYIFSIGRDITNRKEFEEILSKRESKYRSVIETSDDGFWILDLKGKILEVNDAYVWRSGYSREELLTMNVADLTTHENHEEVAVHAQKVLKEGHDRFESHHKTKGGRIWPVEVSANFWNIEDGRIFAFIHDITGRNTILREIEQSKKSLQKILDNAPVGTGLAKLDGRIVYANDSFCRILGYSKEELENLSIQDVTFQEDQQSTSKYLKDLQDETIQVYSGEKRYVRKDDDIIWAHLTVALHKDAYGDTFFISQIEDITQRKILIRELEENEAKFRLLFENANDSMIILDMKKGCIVDLNPATYIQLGYTKEELLGSQISKIVAPDFSGGVSERMAKVRDEGFAVFESAYLDKNGTVIPIEINARLIEKDGKNLAFSIARDITERKKMEKIMIDREALSRAVIERILDS